MLSHILKSLGTFVLRFLSIWYVNDSKRCYLMTFQLHFVPESTSPFRESTLYGGIIQ